MFGCPVIFMAQKLKVFCCTAIFLYICEAIREIVLRVANDHKIEKKIVYSAYQNKRNGSEVTLTFLLF